MLGSRLPEGGLDEFVRLFREDMVLNVFDPITGRAVAELPAALAELRARPGSEIGERDVATVLDLGADDEQGFLEPAEQLRQALARRILGADGGCGDSWDGASARKR